MTLAAVVGAVAMILLAGLAVDGGGQVYARQHATDVAREAARAAGQQLQAEPVMRGDTPRPDTRRAAQAARHHLAAAGVTGTVTVTGTTISVTAHTRYDTVFLGVIGIDQFTVTGTAHARPVRALQGAER